MRVLVQIRNADKSCFSKTNQALKLSRMYEKLYHAKTYRLALIKHITHSFHYLNLQILKFNFLYEKI